MTNLKIGQFRGRETILECSMTANPKASYTWEKDGHRIASSTKYQIQPYEYEEDTVILSLRITITNDSDYGEYKCVGKNKIGEDTGITELYGQ